MSSKKIYFNLLTNNEPEDRFLSPGSLLFLFHKSSLTLHSSGNHTLDDLFAESEVENYDRRHCH